MAVHGTDPTTDRTIMWAVVLVIGTLVAWGAAGSALGEAPGFATALVLGTVVAAVGWRDRITFDLMCNLALVALPAAVVGLCVS
ncbi:hypothetical protein [Nocardioides sp.]|uniref:hypothetical protein n=1 Tax=Nocardioides sp. TaxID=35761 RepID=UPI00378387B6